MHLALDKRVFQILPMFVYLELIIMEQTVYSDLKGSGSCF